MKSIPLSVGQLRKCVSSKTFTKLTTRKGLETDGRDDNILVFFDLPELHESGFDFKTIRDAATSSTNAP